LWRPASGSRAAAASAREQLELVGLGPLAARPAGLLSHGDKRKLEIAILLAGESRLLLLDEPMAGVSAEDVDGLTELIASVHRERSATVIMVEHHVEVVLDLADRIAVMHHGALLACDEPEKVMADTTVQTAYLGEPL
jgi:branched-chain amino acid transport system ATP-binding protein